MPSFPFAGHALFDGVPLPADALFEFAPLAPAVPAPAGDSEELGGGAVVEHGSPMRILLIEDDREAAAYLVRGLKEAGHEGRPRRRLSDPNR